MFSSEGKMITWDNGITKSKTDQLMFLMEDNQPSISDFIYLSLVPHQRLASEMPFEATVA